MDVVCTWLEMRREIKGWRIICRNAIVLHGRAVKLVAAEAVRFPMSGVQHMRDPELPQAVAIVSYRPADSAKSLSVLAVSQSFLSNMDSGHMLTN